MTIHGFGSVHSPIVIDDDDDNEAYDVEQQLVMTSWQEQMESLHNVPSHTNGWTDVLLPPDGDAHDVSSGSMLGQKRKFHEMNPPDPHGDFYAPIWNPQATGSDVSASVPSSSQGESKTARKKRRKRERLAAEQEAAAASMSRSTSVPPLVFVPTHYRQPARIPADGTNAFPHVDSRLAQNRPSASVPSLVYVTQPPPPPLLPPSRYPVVSPTPLVSTLPPKPSALTTSLGQAAANRPLHPLLLAGPSNAPILPMTFRREEPPAAFVPPLAPISTPVPASPIPASTPSPLLPAIKRTIGLPADTAGSVQHGVYTPVNRALRPPKPSCTLVMELLPRKFRNQTFVLAWAKRFDSVGKIRVECDARAGKALIEFSNATHAKEAFDSPRLVGGEGREHVRVYWYRASSPASKVPHVPRPDLEEGEIQEDDNQDQRDDNKFPKKKAKQKQKANKKKAPAISTPPVASTSSQPSVQKQPQQNGWAGRLRSAPNPVPSTAPVFMPPSLFNGWPHVDRSTSFNIPASASSLASASQAANNEATPWHGIREESMDLGTDDGQGQDLSQSPSRGVTPSFSDVPDAKLVGASMYRGRSSWSDEGSIASSRPGSPLPIPHHPPPLAYMPPTTSQPSAHRARWPSPTPPNSDDELYLPVSKRDLVPTSAAAVLPEVILAPSPRLAQSSQLPPAPPPQPSPSPTPPVVSSPSVPVDAPGPAHPITAPVTPPVLPDIPEAHPNPSVDTKEALFARAKELEERIARTKEEIARKAAVVSGSSTPATPTPSPIPRSASSVEDELRRSVLASRGRAASSAHGPAPTPPAAIPAVTAPAASSTSDTSEHGSSTEASVLSSNRSSAGTSVPSSDNSEGSSSTTGTSSPVLGAGETAFAFTQMTTHTRTTASATSLDDLAISFITETIQTVKPQQSTEKLQLAAKQKRLEQQIAESKVLMAKLTAARTKAEKDQIMGILREHRRTTDEGMNADTVTRPPPSPAPSVTYTQTQQSVYRTAKVQWPETAQDAGIFIISDDEDDEG